MPQYAALIYEYGDPGWSTLETPEKQATMGQYGAFGAAVAAVMRGWAALYPATTGTTVQVKGGEVITTDGPFAETSEVLTGFYQFEVRPIRDFGAGAA